ncbi:META domain-containing protein [Nocardioides sp. TF02-7]|uniref:META domain-containing protein n=1 Tax=Nocardioides sp. TF02-7 TaxID=2917724 RepID=UPI001F06B28D|nr:META domain-containing protein [Nocardioides sp. TF02-7]UMG92529.1 META domain-containing protein [Nocardioides sp. TF02-7]
MPLPRRPVLPALLLPAALPLLAGCGSDTGAARDDPAALTLDALDGRAFEGDDLDSPDRALVPGTTVRLRFDGDELSADTGCNHLFGTADADDGSLVVTDMGGTEMGCDPARHDQDAWLTAFLGSGPRAVLDEAILTLSADGTTLVLREAPVEHGDGDPDRPTSDQDVGSTRSAG